MFLDITYTDFTLKFLDSFDAESTSNIILKAHFTDFTPNILTIDYRVHPNYFWTSLHRIQPLIFLVSSFAKFTTSICWQVINRIYPQYLLTDHIQNLALYISSTAFLQNNPHIFLDSSYTKMYPKILDDSLYTKSKQSIDRFYIS